MGTDMKEKGEEETQGILPRMVNDLFVQLRKRSEEECSYAVSVSFWRCLCLMCSFSEIYNEKVYDLLGEKRDSLPLVMNGDVVFVKGLSERRVRPSQCPPHP